MNDTMKDTGNAPNTHPVSVTHLVMGLVFLGAAALWGLAELDLVEVDGARWIAPLVLVVAGAVGLVVSVGRGRRRGTDERSADPGREDTEDTEVLDRQEL